MTVARGAIFGGVVLPGTEFVLRDPAAWWAWDVPEDRVDLRRRPGPIRVLGGHWTGGHARTGPNAGRKVVAAMKARRKDDDGDGVIDADDPLMDVSVHFVVGWDGIVFQTADLLYGTVHMGRGVNSVSVGVETCWPGTAKQARKLGVDGRTERRRFGTRSVECLRPSDELLEGWRRLAAALSSDEVRRASLGVIAIDKVLGTTRPPKSGACEHWQAPSTKNDAAGYLLDALRRDGWR